jgi:ribonuclease VapC
VIVDTSALVAILRAEPDADRFARAIEEADAVRISAATYVELGAVIDQARDPVVSRRVDELLEVGRIEIEALTVEQARVAREAYRDFGRGSGHRAGLNLGDCFAYALAQVSDEPLLFKGDDFTHTDIRGVDAPGPDSR